MRSAYRWTILGTAFLGVFGALGFGRFGYSAVLPDMQRSLGLSGAAAGSLASWNLGAYMAMALVGGLLASKLGPRIVVAVGVAVTAVGMLLTGLSQDLAGASAARLLTGLGNGMVLVPSLALMAAWFEPRRLGLASAIAASGSALGLVVVGTVVPRILAVDESDGWRLAWYFFAAVAAFIGVLTGVLLRNRPGDGTRSAPNVSPPRAPAPLLREFATIVRSGYAWHLGTVYLLYGFAFIIFLTFFQRRLTGDLGYSNAHAGYVFLTVGISSLAFGLAYGFVSDRFGRGRALAATLLLQGLAALVFATRPGWVTLAAAAVVFGSGGFSVPGLVGAACGERFGAKVAAASIGFVTIFVGVGQAAGPYLGGLLADAATSYGPPYFLSAGVFVAAAVAALLLDFSKRSSDAYDPPTAAGTQTTR